MMLRLGLLLLAAVVAASGAGTNSVTSAEQKITAARQVIAAGKATAETHTQLAFALARRARDTADPALYDQANEALEQSLRLAPNNFDALKARVWVLLGKHQFAQAAREAKVLNARMPDDLMVYAMLVDAHAELGNYEEAETAAQWLLDLRPGNITGLSRAAYLREIFGDLEGALELMAQAYNRTPAYEVEDRAWFLTHLGHLQRLSGRLPEADAVLSEALRLLPDYHYALGELARVRTAQKRFPDAVELLRKRFRAAPHPENLYELGVALYRNSKRREAREAFRQFEKQALAESDGADNANRELIEYYIDYGDNPRAALRLAEREAARRKDVRTLDVYAWALQANGQTKEAQDQIKKALAVGTRDPQVLEHAQKIGVPLVRRPNPERAQQGE